MKKFAVIILFLLVGTVCYPQGLLKIGPYAGASFPNDELLKEIYGETEMVYGLKLGVHIWNGFFVFVSGMQYRTVGETTYLGDITRLVLNPVNLSVRYTMPLRVVMPYVQAGYTHLYYSEKSSINEFTDDTGGWSLETGIEFQISRRFILDLGVRYSSVEVNVDVSDEIVQTFDMGSFQVGLSFFVFI